MGPPYFGSYQDLVNALLHDPFLGSGRSRPPVPHVEELRTSDSVQDPIPAPWRSPLISYVGTLAGIEELSRNVTNQAVAEQFAASAEAGFAAFLDEYCATPWPWPGPRPWVIGLASQLVAVANTYQAGSFREGLLSMAGRIAERGVAAPAQAGAVSAG